MNKVMKKCVSLALMLSLLAGLLCGLTGCSQTSVSDFVWLEGEPTFGNSSQDPFLNRSFDYMNRTFDYNYAEAQWIVVKGIDGTLKVLDYSGNQVAVLDYDKIESFHDGLAIVCKDNKYGFINTKAEIVVPLEFDEVTEFSEGFARVKKLVDDGRYYRYGFVNSSGELVVQPEYDDAARAFTEGYAWVRKDGKSGFINGHGEIVIPLEYESVGSFREGLASVQKEKGGKVGFINTAGECTIPMEFDIATAFLDGLAKVWIGGKCGFINTKGEIVIPIKYDEDSWNNFSEGLCQVKLSGKTGFIDTQGQLVIPTRYDGASDFSDGIAPVYVDKGTSRLWGAINTKGEFVVPLNVGNYYPRVSDGLIKVGEVVDVLLVHYGYVDKDGNTVIPVQYRFADDFEGGVTVVGDDYGHGAIDRYGDVVIPLEYDHTYLANNGDVIFVEKDGKWGFCTVILPEEEREEKGKES